MSLAGARVLVLGAGGMLGRDMVRALSGRAGEVVQAGRDAVDLTRADAVAAAVARADIVVNCAAYTNVDGAEAEEPVAHAVNATAAGDLAHACLTAGATLVHISTDYVFDGTATSPYQETDPVSPVSAYGRTKAHGEQLVLDSGAHALVVRTAWLYGAGGRCFPRTIARIAAQDARVTVVDDQRGQPTWTLDLAHFVVALLEAGAPRGIYHGTSSGACTWFEFAQAVVEAAGVAATIEPCATDASARPAVRPAWSVLGHDAHERLGVASIGPWRERWLAASAEVLGA